MDVGSTKRDVIEAARSGLQDQFGTFVPAHPIAGKEVAGVEHADADALLGRQVVLTPIKATLRSNVQRATQVWTGIGAQVCDDDARDARQRLRRREPPAASAGLCLHQRALPGARRRAQHFMKLAGPGFRDFTRIARERPGRLARHPAGQPRTGAGAVAGASADLLRRFEAADGLRRCAGARSRHPAGEPDARGSWKPGSHASSHD